MPSCLYRLDGKRTLVAGGLTLLAVIAANTLRIACLFVMEAARVLSRAAVHDAVGVAAFALAVAGIVVMVRLIAEPADRLETCPTRKTP